MYYGANLLKFLFNVFLFAAPLAYSSGGLACYDVFRDNDSFKEMLLKQLDSAEISQIISALKNIKDLNIKDEKIDAKVVKLLRHSDLDVIKTALKIVKETEDAVFELLNHSDRSILIEAQNAVISLQKKDQGIYRNRLMFLNRKLKKPPKSRKGEFIETQFEGIKESKLKNRRRINEMLKLLNHTDSSIVVRNIFRFITIVRPSAGRSNQIIENQMLEISKKHSDDLSVKKALEILEETQIQNEIIEQKLVEFLNHYRFDIFEGSFLKGAFTIIEKIKNTSDKTNSEWINILKDSKPSIVERASQIIERRNIHNESINDQLVKLLDHKEPYIAKEALEFAMKMEITDERIDNKLVELLNPLNTDAVIKETFDLIKAMKIKIEKVDDSLLVELLDHEDFKIVIRTLDFIASRDIKSKSIRKKLRTLLKQHVGYNGYNGYNGYKSIFEKTIETMKALKLRVPIAFKSD